MSNEQEKAELTQEEIAIAINQVKNLKALFGRPSETNAQNYLQGFSEIFGNMVDFFGSFESNGKFVDFVTNEFLPQYSDVLGFDLEEYQNEVQNRI